MKILYRVSMVIMLMLLASCAEFSLEGAGETPSSDTVSGELLIWHSWEGNERATLRGLLNDFMALYPEVTLVEEYYPLDTVEETFQYQVAAGLGPDILIAPTTWTKRFADEGLIRQIDPETVNLDIYLSATIDMLREGEQMYGLPLSLNTSVLYYNRNLFDAVASRSVSPDTQPVVAEPTPPAVTSTSTDTDTITGTTETAPEPVDVPPPPPEPTSETANAPPTTLDELLQQASQGKIVAMRADFYGAFWGIQAFGGELFDENGRVVLNQGGFANWLSWLKTAQDNPFIILNRNVDELALLFTSGRATFYVGNTQELPALQAALGPNVVEVVRLPGRQNNAAGPFLQAEALMFNRVSASRSFDLSMRLAQYLTNAEQQRQLALSVGKLPANRTVNIDPRVAPLVAEFIAQSKTAVPIALKNIDKFNDVLSYGDDVYAQFLDGQMNVGEAATLITEQVNEKHDLRQITSRLLANCDLEGQVTLWNTWTGKSNDVLRQVQERFNDQCPAATVVIRDKNAVDFISEYRTVAETDEGPELFTGHKDHIRMLARDELLLNLSELLPAHFSQRFIPMVEQASLYRGNLYGIPVNVNVMAMYYNTELVEDPPLVLNDLLTTASPERQIALPIGFTESFWGVAAFGESRENTQFLNEENRLVIGQFGLVEWLTWLKEAENQPGFVFSTDRTELQNMFIEGEVAMLVGDVSPLETLQEALGDNLRVIPLPSGSPLLTVDNIFINPYTSPEEREIALLFAQLMTELESQNLLLREAHKVPININISTANHPLIEVFLQQANVATIVPNVSQVNAIFEWGALLYEQVLDNDIPPAEAVKDFTDLVNVTNGFQLSEPVLAEECTEEGEITLWHSWSEIEQLAWQDVISNFSTLCPSVQITTTFVAAPDFTGQLTATLQADSQLALPDFFIAPHTSMETFQEAGLIKNISGLVDQTLLIDFAPRTVNAFTAGEDLFALPQTVHLPALYYRPNMVEVPPLTLDDLRLQARQGLTVALSTQFYDLFWGASALGCQPCQTGQFFDEQGELVLTPDDIAPWLAWLEEMAQLDSVIFSDDPAMLRSLFLQEQVVYLVTGPDFLNQAQSTLGVANVAVAPLPSGLVEQDAEEGEMEIPPNPFLQVNGFYFYQGAPEAQTQLALKFARIALADANQTLLMQEANFLPTSNLALITANVPALEGFISRLETTIAIPRQSRRIVIEESPLYDIFNSLTPDVETSE